MGSLSLKGPNLAQSWTVPAGVTSVKVKAWGADGGGTLPAR